MKIKFYKYHGAGNDFIILDDREFNYSFSIKNENFIHGLKLTISAIILLEEIIKNMTLK